MRWYGRGFVFLLGCVTNDKSREIDRDARLVDPRLLLLPSSTPRLHVLMGLLTTCEGPCIWHMRVRVFVAFAPRACARCIQVGGGGGAFSPGPLFVSDSFDTQPMLWVSAFV